MSAPTVVAPATILTGAAGGLGRSIAMGLARRGARLCLVDLDGGALEVLAADVRGAGTQACTVAVDMTGPDAGAQVVEVCRTTFARVDAVVTAAGVAGRGRVEDLDDELIDRVLAVNIASVVRLCRRAIPELRLAGGGVIVNIASAAALREWPGSALYAASKAAVVALTRTMAADHVAEGIRAWAVCPTAVRTPMFGRTFDGEADPESAAREFIASQPMGRLIEPDEITRVITRLVMDPPPMTPDPLVV